MTKLAKKTKKKDKITTNPWASMDHVTDEAKKLIREGKLSPNDPRTGIHITGEDE